MVCSCPEREEVAQRPGEVVARVCVDGLEETERDPDVDGEDVEVVAEEAVEEWSGDGSLGEDHDLKRVCVLGGESYGGRELVVELVDVLVEGSPVEATVSPVVEHVLKDKEESNLTGHDVDWREWHLVGGHAKVGADGVEQPDEGGFTCKVGEEDDLCALPDLGVRDCLSGLELPFTEVGHGVDDQPGDGTAKVDDLVLVCAGE